MEVLILAGGMGTRLSSLVSDRPKPLADVNGRPFLEYLMDYLINYDTSHFILLTGYKSGKIRDHFGGFYRSIKVSYSEETEPLGTGGAVVHGLKHLKTQDPFLVVNGDTFFEIDLNKLRNFYAKTNADVSIGLFRANQTKRYGRVVQDQEAQITEIGLSAASIGQPAVGGTFLISRKIMEYFTCSDTIFSMEKHFLPEIIVNGGIVNGILYDDGLNDIGTPNDYMRFCKNQS